MPRAHQSTALVWPCRVGFYSQVVVVVVVVVMVVVVVVFVVGEITYSLTNAHG